MSVIQVSKETSEPSRFAHGHTVVGTTAVPLTSLGLKFDKGILVRTPGSEDPSANTACVWVGRKGVTADSDPGTGGLPIPPGQSVLIPIDDPTAIYVISSAVDQDVAWMGV